MASEASRERTHKRGAPWHSRFLSRAALATPPKESLLAGYLESFIFLFFFFFTRSVCAITREVKPSADRKMIKHVTVDHYDIFAILVVYL